MEHFVYFIQRSGDKAVKIGVAKDPETRLKQLQTGSSEPLTLIASFPCPGRKEAFELERDLHRRCLLSGPRGKLNGEWFHPLAVKGLFKRMVKRDEQAVDHDDVGRVVNVSERAISRIRKLSAENRALKEWGQYWHDRAQELEEELAEVNGTKNRLIG